MSKGITTMDPLPEETMRYLERRWAEDIMGKEWVQNHCDHEYDAWMSITPQPCKKCGKLCEPMKVTC